MPIENEVKFVLSNIPGLEAELCGLRPCEITQVYTRGGGRFRAIEWPHSDIPPSYTFTYKERLGGDLLEFEQAITGEDFVLAERHATERLRKRRRKIPDRDYDWDIDVLLHPQTREPYFALAEVEMPVGAVFDPARMLVRLKPFVRHAVEPSDSLRFTNHKLCDPDYAGSLMAIYGGPPSRTV